MGRHIYPSDPNWIATRRPLRFKCPDCGRYLAPLEQMTTATQVAKRTCSRCHAYWQIVVTPKPVNGPVVKQYDVGEFTRLGVNYGRRRR